MLQRAKNPDEDGFQEIEGEEAAGLCQSLRQIQSRQHPLGFVHRVAEVPGPLKPRNPTETFYFNKDEHHGIALHSTTNLELNTKTIQPLSSNPNLK